jgi:hypothetical protein
MSLRVSFFLLSVEMEGERLKASICLGSHLSLFSAP